MQSSDAQRPGNVALVYEKDGTRWDSTTRQLERLGWRAEALDTTPESWAGWAAQLWAIDLVAYGPPSGFAHTLLHLDERPPLLLVSDAPRLDANERQVARLIREWPSRAELLLRPWHAAELRYRTASLLYREADPDVTGWIYRSGGLCVDTVKQEAFAAGQLLKLSHAEYMILAALAENPGRTHSKHALSKLVHAGEEFDESLIESHVSRIRRHLADAGLSPDTLHTIRGVGYRLDESQL
jgi:DNA-binding response OmpR family regulator